MGSQVTWYGDKDQMVVLPTSQVHGMWGNIYDNDKLKFVTELINTTDNMNVEFECSYGIGGVIDFRDIREEQEAVQQERFETDYDGKELENAASTGDSNLDIYVGTEDIEYLDFIDNQVSEENILMFFDKNRFSLIEERSTVGQLENTFKKLGPDESELEAFKEFIEYEKALKEAESNDDGDFNRFSVQLRDGHHRVFGAKAAGEDYVCVNLDKESIERYPEYITRVTS